MLLIKNNKLYDILKYTAQILLPAAGALYYGLAQVWGLPNADQLVGTIVVVDTFLGVVLHLSSTAYEHSGAKYDGVMEVTNKVEGGKLFSMNLNTDPDTLHSQKEAIFKIDNQTDS